MAWAEVFGYIATVSPTLVDDLIGVPEDHILASERGLDLRLPAAYRDFLLAMGVDAGVFCPLGGAMEWNFYDLLRELPAEDYSPTEFFRIATESNDTLDTPSDLYLDMQTVDVNGDCDVLMIESFLPPTRKDAARPRESFLEIVAKQIWRILDAPRFAHSRVVFASPKHTEEIIARKTTILEVFQHAGFHHTLPTVRRVDCLSLDGDHSGTARVEHDEYGLTSFVASNSESTVARLTQLLLDNVEGARVSEQFVSLQSLRH